MGRITPRARLAARSPFKSKRSCCMTGPAGPFTRCRTPPLRVDTNDCLGLPTASGSHCRALLLLSSAACVPERIACRRANKARDFRAVSSWLNCQRVCPIEAPDSEPDPSNPTDRSRIVWDVLGLKPLPLASQRTLSTGDTTHRKPAPFLRIVGSNPGVPPTDRKNACDARDTACVRRARACVPACAHTGGGIRGFVRFVVRVRVYPPSQLSGELTR